MTRNNHSYALVTGASGGIGKAIAYALAKRGYQVLLLARSTEQLKQISEDITNQHGVKTDFLGIDLGTLASADMVLAWLAAKKYDLSILVNNAGYGIWGEFETATLDGQLGMCQLNMATLVALTSRLLPLLKSPHQAHVLNVASTAAYQAVPTLSVYAATKAFVLSFSRGLRYELKDTNINVSCLSPGPVDTGFAQRAGLDPFSKLAQKFNMQADEVAEIAVKGMLDKKSEIIPGWNNKISAFATRLLPKFLIERIAAGIYK